MKVPGLVGKCLGVVLCWRLVPRVFSVETRTSPFWIHGVVCVVVLCLWNPFCFCVFARVLAVLRAFLVCYFHSWLVPWFMTSMWFVRCTVAFYSGLPSVLRSWMPCFSLCLVVFSIKFHSSGGESCPWGCSIFLDLLGFRWLGMFYFLRTCSVY